MGGIGSGQHGNHAKGPSHPKWKGRAAVRRTYLYRLWLAIRSRCNTVSNQDYSYYGGRGIKVCQRWDSYDTFETDILTGIGPRPGPGWTLDRVDNNKDYELSNVRWATRETQSRNRPSYLVINKTIADQIRKEYIRGVTRQVDIAAQYGITQCEVSQIIRGVTWR